MCIHVFLFGGVVVLLFMKFIKLHLILKCSVLILKFSHVLHIHKKKVKKGLYLKFNNYHFFFPFTLKGLHFFFFFSFFLFLCVKGKAPDAIPHIHIFFLLGSVVVVLFHKFYLWQLSLFV